MGRRAARRRAGAGDARADAEAPNASCFGSRAAAAAVRAAAAGRPTRDSALVQFRLAVRLSARGAWLAEAERGGLRLWSRASAALSAADGRALSASRHLRPARHSPRCRLTRATPPRFSLRLARASRMRRPGARRRKPPDFVVVDNWRVGGRVGVALGPGDRRSALHHGPRGFAFECDPAALVGRGRVDRPASGQRGAAIAGHRPYFQTLQPSEASRSGAAEGPSAGFR